MISGLEKLEAWSFANVVSYKFAKRHSHAFCQWFLYCTTLQSIMNAKLIKQRFLHCDENRHQDDSNDTPQPLGECQVDFPVLWIKAYPGLS